jgi:hypothetical protein
VWWMLLLLLLLLLSVQYACCMYVYALPEQHC